MDPFKFAETCSEKEVRDLGTIVNRRIREFNDKKKESKSTEIVIIDPWAQKLAELIWENVQSVYPLAKEPDIVKWSQDIARINKVDKIDRPMVELVLAHALQDNFWKNQIRSGAALRRHFEKIYMNGRSKFDEQAAKRPKVYKV